jgi:hypothetical protein
VRYFELPCNWWAGDGGLCRLRNYHLQQIRHATIRKALNRCLRCLTPVLPRREFPNYLNKPYGGEAWMGFN